MIRQLVIQSSVDDDNRAANTSRLLNCYKQAGDENVVIKAVPGTESLADLGEVFLKAIERVGNTIYAAANGRLLGVVGTTVTDIGALSFGETFMSSNNGILTVAANGVYYTWDGTTLAKPTGANFSSVGSVAYIGQYTMLTERGGSQFAWSDVADPNTLPALNFTTADGRDDKILRGLAIGGRFVVFKETSREVWYQTGQSGADAFARMAGAVIDTGLKSSGLVTPIDSGAFFVGDDNIAYVTDGIGQRPVSNVAVNTSISKSDPTNCFYYEAEGQKICVIRFSDRPSWCLDLSTMEWHERSEDVVHKPWSAVASVRLNNEWIIGTTLGKLYKLKQVNTDADFPLKRTIVSRTFGDGANRFSLSKVEIYGRMGYSDLGRDAQAVLRLSRDGGQTWTPEKWRSFGTLGNYGKRAVWRAQGQARKITMEISITDPAEIPIYNDFDMVVS